MAREDFALLLEKNKKGRHEWLIEFKNPPKDCSQFIDLLDQFLKQENSDYEAKRYKDITLALPKLEVAKKNLFYSWMAKKKKLGGQHKVPRLSNKRDVLEELLKINRA